MLIIIYGWCSLGKASLKRLGGRFGYRQECQGENEPSLERCREGSQKQSRSQCTEVGMIELCAEGGGLLQIWLGEGLGLRVTQNRISLSPSSQFAFPPPPLLPGPLSACLCPDSFVRTAPPLHPHPCSRDSKNLSNVSDSKCWRKRRNIKEKTLFPGLCLRMTSQSSSPTSDGHSESASG